MMSSGVFFILLGCFAEVRGGFLYRTNEEMRGLRGFFPIFNAGNIQRNTQYETKWSF